MGSILRAGVEIIGVRSEFGEFREGIDVGWGRCGGGMRMKMIRIHQEQVDHGSGEVDHRSTKT